MTIRFLGFSAVHVLYTIKNTNVGKPSWKLQISRFFDLRRSRVFLRWSRFYSDWKSMWIHILGFSAVHVLYEIQNTNVGKPSWILHMI